MRHNVDHFDGHLLVTEWDVAPEFLPADPERDELVHYVEHPPTCIPSVVYEDTDAKYYQHRCIAQEHHENCGEWPEATTEGVRVIGWRVDTYTCGFSTEYDVVAFAVGDPFPFAALRGNEKEKEINE